MDRRRKLDGDGGERRRPTVVRLMPDYGGMFLWNLSPDEPADDRVLEPDDLGLSPGLIERLIAWHAAWERGTGRMSRRFAGSGGAGREAWYREGLRLAYRLQKELGPDVEVLYRDARGEERPVNDLRGL